MDWKPFDTIFVPLLIGIGSAWVTALFGFDKYRNERWWDRKVDAYMKIMDSLYGYLDSLRKLVRETKKTGEIASGLMQNSPNPSEIELEEALSSQKESMRPHYDALFSHYRIVQKEVDIGAFIISDEVYKLLKKFIGESRDRSDGTQRSPDEMEESIRACIKNFIILAKQDLEMYKPKRRSFKFKN